MKILRALSILGAVGVIGLFTACGGGVDSGDDGAAPSPSPTPVSFTLSQGPYDYAVETEIADTCWAPPKTNVAVPIDLVADITDNGDGNFTVFLTVQQVPLTFNIVKTGDKLAGTGSGDLDLNAQANIDCIIHVEGTFDGSMTADDQFTASQAFHLTEGGGGQCALAVGTLIPDQLDQLPCDLELGGSAAYK